MQGLEQLGISPVVVGELRHGPDLREVIQAGGRISPEQKLHAIREFPRDAFDRRLDERQVMLVGQGATEKNPHLAIARNSRRQWLPDFGVDRIGEHFNVFTEAGIELLKFRRGHCHQIGAPQILLKLRPDGLKMVERPVIGREQGQGIIEFKDQPDRWRKRRAQDVIRHSGGHAALHDQHLNLAQFCHVRGQVSVDEITYRQVFKLAAPLQVIQRCGQPQVRARGDLRIQRHEAHFEFRGGLGEFLQIIPLGRLRRQQIGAPGRVGGVLGVDPLHGIQKQRETLPRHRRRIIAQRKLTGDLRNMGEREMTRQPDPQVPILMAAERFIKVARFLQENLLVHEAQHRHKIVHEYAVVVPLVRVGHFPAGDLPLAVNFYLPREVRIGVGDGSGFIREKGDQGFQMRGMEQIVVIQVGKVFALGGADPGVASTGEALVYGVSDQPDAAVAIVRRDHLGHLRARVVDHNDLKIPIGLFENALECLGQPVRPVERRHNHGNQRHLRRRVVRGWLTLQRVHFSHCLTTS